MRKLFLACVAALAIFYPINDASAKPPWCSGSIGSCEWTVHNEDDGYWMGFSWGGPGGWQPIDGETACDLCCRHATLDPTADSACAAA